MSLSFLPSVLTHHNVIAYVFLTFPQATGEVERLSKGAKERGGKASPAGRDELAALRYESA